MDSYSTSALCMSNGTDNSGAYCATKNETNWTLETEGLIEENISDTEGEMLLKDRRRAKSLPAYPEHVTLFEEISKSCRKKVKFADALGLSLASVRHFSVAEDPQIPSKVLSRLRSFPSHRDGKLLDVCGKLKSTMIMHRWVPTFKMPVECNEFGNRWMQQRVALEKITVTLFDVRGLIRIPASSFTQEVGVRYTFNDWHSFVDAQAIPTEDCSSSSQQYSFTMYTPPFMEAGSSVHFAVYAKTDHGEFWDNNEGQNYTLKYHCTSDYETAAFSDI